MKTLALLLALSSTALASEDVGSVMASLNDQKAECRYLLQLCDEYGRAKTLATEKGDTAKAAVDHAKEANRAAIQFGSAGKDAKRAAQSAMTAWNAAIIVTERKLGELATAAKVMKAKREKMPACVAECVGPAGEKLLEPW